jgi:hypothetical protein
MKNSHLNYLVFFMFILSFLSCKKETVVDPPNNDEIVELPEIRWKSGEDIIIKTDLYVNKARLIIEPGVTVKIKNGCSIIIGENYYADITAIGTIDKPINFLPYNPDGNIENPYWGGIRIIRNPYNESNTIFEYCNFIKGGGEGAEAVIYSENGKLSINNCLIDYSKSYGIKIGSVAELLGFSGNTIRHTLNHPIWTTLKSAGKIEKNNTIQSDSVNHGILVEYVGHGNDTVTLYNHAVPYVVSGILKVSSNPRILNITLEAGTTIAFEKNSSMEIGSKTIFNAIGTDDEPIVFTSSQIEKQAGDWKNISFYSGAPIWLDNCVFEYGGKSDPYMPNDNGILVVHGSFVSIKNSLIQHSASSGIDLFSQSQNLSFPDFVDFKGNTFNDLNGYAVTLFPQSIFSLEKENDYGDFGVYVKESEIGSGTHLWKNIGADYFVDGDIGINASGNGAKVVIEPGVVIKFISGGFHIGYGSQFGTLLAEGTEDMPIIFTSAKDNPQRGDWGAIKFYSGAASGCILDHCQILYGGASSINGFAASIHICCNMINVTVKNSTIAHSSSSGIHIYGNAMPNFDNNTFFDNVDGDYLWTGKEK